jgi:hypothetical protein
MKHEKITTGFLTKEDFVEAYQRCNDDFLLRLLGGHLNHDAQSQLVLRTGISRDAVIDWRMGRSRPHPRNRDALVAALRELKLI